ncbi:MAG TPA: prepilin-type N-terminal cleavage/methylation domain-containing protein [Magnetospirillaceae bacterium]|jgi:general secretion pathway protein J
MTEPARHRRENEAGFTLIEMIVAMTLLAILALVVTGSIGFGGRVAEAATTRSERLDRLWTGYTLMRNQIAAAYAPKANTARADAFAGSTDILALIAPAPPQLPMGGDQRVAFHIERSASGKELVAEWQAQSSAERPRRSILIEGLAAGAFAYVGPTDQAQWLSRWDQADALPRLVRFAGTFTDGTALPSFIAAPRLSGSEE